MDPRLPDAHLAGIQPGLVEVEGSQYLSLIFRRNPDATDVDFILETSRSNAGISWGPEIPAMETPAGTDSDGMPLYEFRVLFNGGILLSRLKVE